MSGTGTAASIRQELSNDLTGTLQQNYTPLSLSSCVVLLTFKFHGQIIEQV